MYLITMRNGCPSGRWKLPCSNDMFWEVNASWTSVWAGSKLSGFSFIRSLTSKFVAISSLSSSAWIPEMWIWKVFYHSLLSSKVTSLDTFTIFQPQESYTLCFIMRSQKHRCYTSVAKLSNRGSSIHIRAFWPNRRKVCKPGLMISM